MKRIERFPYPVPDDFEDDSYYTTSRMNEAMGKMDRARGFLIAQEPWYGHFAIQMEWESSTALKMPTMGVMICQDGKIKCLWHPMFVMTRTIFMLASAIKHEIEHIVRLHPVRRDDRNNDKWNIATDMTINGSKSERNIAIKEDSESMGVLPFSEEEGVSLVWRPDRFSAEASAEELYEMLEDQGGGTCSGGQPSDQQKPFDDHDSWEDSAVTPEHARQIVQGMTDSATKSCGKSPGNLKAALKDLNAPIVNWRHQFRTVFGRSVGKTRRVLSKLDRRRPVFGRPGKTRRGSGKAFIICDTSGSVSSAEFEQFFSEIDGSICQNVQVSILQWDDQKDVADANLKDIYWPLYRRGQWKQIERIGGGGTNMDEAVEYAAKSGLLRGSDILVVFTDGYTPWFEGDIGIPIINVITGASGSATPPKTQTNLYMNMGRR